MSRDYAHIFLGDRYILRCCMECNGQTRLPHPAPMIHEATCPRLRKVKQEFAPLPEWRFEVGVL